MTKYRHLILPVETRLATELKGHREGPGQRFVFADHNNLPKGNIYAIVRKVANVRNPKPHVDLHSHDCDSLWMFLGHNPDLTGLTAEITLGDEKYEIESPASVHIPAGIRHTYCFVRGSGQYVNIVLAPGGKYNTATKK